MESSPGGRTVVVCDGALHAPWWTGPKVSIMILGVVAHP